jgi:hypothetical protein
VEETQATPEAARPGLPDRQVSLHLQSLIAATATLSGNGVTGSAFFIEPGGHLITNHHVINRMTEISVQTSDGKSQPGRVIQSDPRLDLALVKADGGPYPTLKIGDATILEQGEAVWTIGAPHGLSFTVTRGIVSYVGRNVNGRAFIQADVAINPGNSGGPMINERGEVVGINNFIVSNAVGLNFAIPINYINMGSACIGADVIPTSPDNAVMAKWRSWEQGTGLATRGTNRPSQSLEEPVPDSDEVERLIQELTNLKNQFDQKRNQRDATIARTTAQLKEQQDRYQGGTDSISQESAGGDQIRKLTQEILREQISLADDTLEYCNRQEALLGQIQNASADESLLAQVQTQTQQLRQLRAATQSSKEKAALDLRNTEEAVY